MREKAAFRKRDTSTPCIFGNSCLLDTASLAKKKRRRLKFLERKKMAAEREQKKKLTRHF
jgi:hypothetical protein